jgi:hypothetical protein
VAVSAIAAFAASNRARPSAARWIICMRIPPAMGRTKKP